MVLLSSAGLREGCWELHGLSPEAAKLFPGFQRSRVSRQFRNHWPSLTRTRYSQDEAANTICIPYLLLKLSPRAWDGLRVRARIRARRPKFLCYFSSMAPDPKF